MEPISIWQKKTKNALKGAPKNIDGQLEAVIRSFGVDGFEDVKFDWPNDAFLGISPARYDNPIAKMNAQKLDKEVKLYAVYPAKASNYIEIITVTDLIDANEDETKMLISTAENAGLNALGGTRCRVQKSMCLPSGKHLQQEIDSLKRVNVLYTEFKIYQTAKQEERKRWVEQTVELLQRSIPPPYS